MDTYYSLGDNQNETALGSLPSHETGIDLYDVFISYHDNDKDWVMNVLQPRLTWFEKEPARYEAFEGGSIYWHAGDTRDEFDDLADASSSLHDWWTINNSDELEKAIPYYEQSLKITRELGDHLEASRILCDLGRSYRCLDRLGRAIACYEEALEINTDYNRNSRRHMVDLSSAAHYLLLINAASIDTCIDDDNSKDSNNRLSRSDTMERNSIQEEIFYEQPVRGASVRNATCMAFGARSTGTRTHSDNEQGVYLSMEENKLQVTNGSLDLRDVIDTIAIIAHLTPIHIGEPTSSAILNGSFSRRTALSQVQTDRLEPVFSNLGRDEVVDMVIQLSERQDEIRDTTYYWQVRAYNTSLDYTPANRVSGWRNFWWSTTTGTSRDAFCKVLTVNSTVNQATSLALLGNSGVGATSYGYYVATINACLAKGKANFTLEENRIQTKNDRIVWIDIDAAYIDHSTSTYRGHSTLLSLWNGMFSTMRPRALSQVRADERDILFSSLGRDEIGNITLQPSEKQDEIRCTSVITGYLLSQRETENFRRARQTSPSLLDKHHDIKPSNITSWSKVVHADIKPANVFAPIEDDAIEQRAKGDTSAMRQNNLLPSVTLCDTKPRSTSLFPTIREYSAIATNIVGSQLVFLPFGSMGELSFHKWQLFSSPNHTLGTILIFMVTIFLCFVWSSQMRTKNMLALIQIIGTASNVPRLFRSALSGYSSDPQRRVASGYYDAFVSHIGGDSGGDNGDNGQPPLDVEFFDGDGMTTIDGYVVVESSRAFITLKRELDDADKERGRQVLMQYAYENRDLGVYLWNLSDASTAQPTDTPRPTSTSRPTGTPEPTSTPEPTDTATPVPIATTTATPVPIATTTATPVPTATATATPEPTATTTATATLCVPEQPRTVDVMLVIDRSSSMDGKEIRDAKAAAITFLHLLDLSQSQVGLVTFAKTAALDSPLTHDAAMVEAALDNVKIESGSYIDTDINTAANELIGAKRNPLATPIMIVLSDGRATDESQTRVAAAQAKARGIRILTIGMGHHMNEVFLRDVASAPEDFYASPSSSDLMRIYTQIAATIVTCQAPINNSSPSSLAPLEKSTPEPTDTPRPTSMSRPTGTPEPTGTPIPGDTMLSLVEGYFRPERPGQPYRLLN